MFHFQINLDNSSIKSPKKVKNLDSSIDNGYNDINDNKNSLPIIKNNLQNEYKYDLPSINITKDRTNKHIETEGKKPKKDNAYHASKQSNASISKIHPYVNNEHISNVYKYAPSYLKQSSSKNALKYNDKGILYKNNNYNYLDKKGVNLELIGLNNGKLPIIPNRKLSPIRKQIKV